MKIMLEAAEALARSPTPEILADILSADARLAPLRGSEQWRASATSARSDAGPLQNASDILAAVSSTNAS